MQKIRKAAKAGGKTWAFDRQGAKHEIWKCGSTSVAIPRHNEIKLGLALGMLAGALRGLVDQLIMRVLDVVFAFPLVLLAIALSGALTPAGLGFAEGAIVGVLLLAARAGLAPGVDEHAAASIALLDRGISYWSIVGVGLIVYPLSRRK